MTYRCTFLGHAFGEPEIKREQDERGDVLVTTVREVETCRRCDETNVVHEYPITTPLEPADDDDAGGEHLEDDEGGTVGATRETSAVVADPQRDVPRALPANSSGEYTCSECEFRVPGDGSPLQAGDLCPECHRGYLGPA